MLAVVQSPDPRLHEVSRPVREDEFGPELDARMDEMVDTLRAERGAGLAGVQVGDLRRIILVHIGPGTEPEKMVNPVVVAASKLTRLDTEGCLSFPNRKVTKPRARQVTVEYRSPLGEVRKVTLFNFEARCVLHEIDHLNGKTIL